MEISRIALCLALLGSVSALSLQNKGVNADKKLVCYFGSWATYRPGDGKYDVENIDPMLCTHLVFGFAGLGYDHKIVALDPYNELEENWGKGAYRRFNNLKKRNPSLVTILAIGGWNEGSEKYSNMAKNADTRRIFIDSVVEMLQKEGFDGLDLDWEYPTQRGGDSVVDRENFAQLCRELRDEFNKHGLLLTAAVSAGQFTIEEAYDVPSIAQSLDFISIMAYDFRGAWEHHPYTGHHSALNANSQESGNETYLNARHAVEFWMRQGAPASKLILGMPTYGRGFILQDPSNTGFYSPATQGIPAGPFTRESGYWGYNELCEELSKGGWETVKDPNVVGPYSYKGTYWIGYDDVNTIVIKSEWINSMGLGGGMFWSLETDDFHGKCGEKDILIRTAHRGLIGDLQPEPTTTVDPTAPTTTSTTTTTLKPPPPDGDCERVGQILGELCDRAFYVCNWNGQSWDRIMFPCRDQLYFDPLISNCNWGDLIGCTK